MRLVVGLGNPGARYARTRHNVGWRVVETLVERWSAVAGERSTEYRTWRAVHAGEEVNLMVPLTYMNLSGEAVTEWRKNHELSLEALLVVSDDVYLPVGTVRLRARGSSGGHRGLESIAEALGGTDFARLRIGVGESHQADLREHVLAKPSQDETRVLDDSIEYAADAVTLWVAEGIHAAMNRFNRRAGKEVSES